ncbi:hypothetical protein ACVFI8_06205 [Agarivorans sp. MS3-6]
MFYKNMTNTVLDKSFFSILNQPELLKLHIEKTIVKRSVSAGYISQYDVEENTPRYNLLLAAVERNLQSQQLMAPMVLVGKNAVTTGEARSIVELKIDTVSRNIAKRILDTSPALD